MTRWTEWKCLSRLWTGITIKLYYKDKKKTIKLYTATKSVANATKFLLMRSYLNMHSPFATEKIGQLVAK